jgi:hypothetical protein
MLAHRSIRYARLTAPRKQPSPSPTLCYTDPVPIPLPRSGLLEQSNAPERRSRACFEWTISRRRRVIGDVTPAEFAERLADDNHLLPDPDCSTFLHDGEGHH